MVIEQKERERGQVSASCTPGALQLEFLNLAKTLKPAPGLIGVTRFELAAPASRKQCSTRLSYTPFINNFWLPQIQQDLAVICDRVIREFGLNFPSLLLRAVLQRLQCTRWREWIQ